MEARPRAEGGGGMGVQRASRGGRCALRYCRACVSPLYHFLDNERRFSLDNIFRRSARCRADAPGAQLRMAQGKGKYTYSGLARLFRFAARLRRAFARREERLADISYDDSRVTDTFLRIKNKKKAKMKRFFGIPLLRKSEKIKN